MKSDVLADATDRSTMNLIQHSKFPQFSEFYKEDFEIAVKYLLKMDTFGSAPNALNYVKAFDLGEEQNAKIVTQYDLADNGSLLLTFPSICRMIRLLADSEKPPIQKKFAEKKAQEISIEENRLPEIFRKLEKFDTRNDGIFLPGIVSLTFRWNIKLLINFCLNYPTPETPISKTCSKDVYDATIGFIITLVHSDMNTAFHLGESLDLVDMVLKFVRPISIPAIPPKFTTDCATAIEAKSGSIYEKTMEITHGVLSQDGDYMHSTKISTDRFLALQNDEETVFKCIKTQRIY